MNQPKLSTKLTQKAYLNSIAALMDYIAKVGVSFFITPILVSGLGRELFGAWQILNRLVSYMSAADGKPTQALKFVIANKQHSDDVTLKRQAIGCAFGVWLIMLPVMTVAGGILIWIAPYVVKTAPEYIMVIRISALLLIFSLMIGGLVTLPESVLRGMNLGYKRMGVVAGLNILGGIFIAGAIYMGWGIIGVATAYLIQTIFTGLIFWFLIKIYVSWFGVVRVTMKEVRSFFGLSLWFAVWNIVNKLLLVSDVVVLGMVVSASSVTDYVLTGYVAQTLIAVVTMVVGAAVPGIGGFIGQKNYKKVIELRKEMLWMSCLAVGVMGSMILLWNKSFIALWVGSGHYAGLWVNLALVLIAAQLMFLRNETFLIDLTLNLRKKVILGFISALASIVLAAIFAHYFKILGLCMGVFCGRLILSIAYPAITGNFLANPLGVQFRPLVRPLAATTVIFALAVYLGHVMVITTWFYMIVFMSLSFPLTFGLLWWSGFSAPQRKLLMARITSVKIRSLTV